MAHLTFKIAKRSFSMGHWVTVALCKINQVKNTMCLVKLTAKFLLVHNRLLLLLTEEEEANQDRSYEVRIKHLNF
jgi:hypothetical protein